VKDGGNWYVYVENNPVAGVDPQGLMSVKLLNMIKDAYIRGNIKKDDVGSVVLLVNLFSLAGDFLQKITVAVSLNIRDIMDWFSEVEEELKSDSPSKQAIYVAFHETAQVLAAKEIYEAYPELSTWLNPYPKLEELTSGLKEMDISFKKYVWEVKPGYTSASSFAKSLNKYVKDYSESKAQKDYDTKLGLKVPGGSFNDITARLFELNGNTVNIRVKWLGSGKVGYFFELKCGPKQFQESYAVDVMELLRPAFDKADELNNASVVGGLVLAAIAAIFTPIPGDEAAAAVALVKALEAVGLA
jgi:hypothetical protein